MVHVAEFVVDSDNLSRLVEVDFFDFEDGSHRRDVRFHSAPQLLSI